MTKEVKQENRQTKGELPPQTVGEHSEPTCATQFSSSRQLPDLSGREQQHAGFAGEKAKGSGYFVASSMLECPHSGFRKPLRDETALRKHMLVHSPRQHLCAQCGRAFTESSTGPAPSVLPIHSITLTVSNNKVSG